ncbi:MAG: hypothetical protein AAFO94_06550 [Bacteroidota bacterium]
MNRSSNLCALMVTMVTLLIGCKKAPVETTTKSYLHLAHVRMKDNATVCPQLADMDLGRYDALLLGGDLALQTSVSDAVMARYDSLFSFGESRTLWALGNHDYDDLKRVQQFTGRPAYYSYRDGPVQFLVLDTQDSLSHIVGDQLELIRHTIDTMAFAKYLIVLHHKLIWMPGHPELSKQIGQVANAPEGSCFYCTNPNNFYEALYPLLLNARRKGVGVYCVGGDLGYHRKSFSYVTSDGVHFLASGFNFDDVDNRALLLKFDSDSSTIQVSFPLHSEL